MGFGITTSINRGGLGHGLSLGLGAGSVGKRWSSEPDPFGFMLVDPDFTLPDNFLDDVDRIQWKYAGD